MPGYIMHLAAAKLAIDKLGICDLERCSRIYAGSVIADTMPREDKRLSHFWTGDTMKYLKRVPDTETFLTGYPQGMDDDMISAYYAHLYMDRVFVDEYWGSHFEFYNDAMEYEAGYDEVTKVRIAGKDEILDRRVFLSDEYYYGDYTRLLPYIVCKYGLLDIFGGKNIKDYCEMIKKLDYSGISGYCCNYDETALVNMFYNVYNVGKNGNNSYGKAPELKVFIISELEKLIEDTSEILKNMLSIC